MPTATELAIAFKKAIDRQDAATLMRLAKTYRELYTRLLPKMDSLILAMSKMDEPTTGQMYRLAQYKSLLKSAEEEFNKYAAYTEIEIRTGTRAAGSVPGILQHHLRRGLQSPVRTSDTCPRPAR